MEGKLIKIDKDEYALMYKRAGITLEHDPAFDGKLSLKNCEAIANGYDLDEEISNIVKTIVPDDRGEGAWFGTSIAVGKLCFKKALELMGDKKFSEDDLYHAFLINSAGNNTTLRNFFEQTVLPMFNQDEWDVEIVMDICGDKVYAVPEPALDADGCLILKRK